MRVRTLLVAFLMASLPLAGCLGGDDGDDLGDASTNATDPNTAPLEGRGSLVAFEETNQTEEGSGGLDHHHDYWEGRSRVTIFEQRAKMQPMAARHAAEYEAAATFRPVLGAMVYEGTTQVDFTVTQPGRHACVGEDTVDGDYVCTSNLDYYAGTPAVPPADDPAGGPQGLKLRYKHAATTSWIDAGPLQWDQPITIKITDPVQTDMPHATSSLWEFQIVSPNKQDSTLTFVAKADVVRGEGDIPLWPGHPDFYPDNLTTRVVLQTRAVAGDPGLYGHGDVLVPENAGPVSPDKLISYGTRTLHVWINITSVNAPNPALAPSSWFLFHTNASGKHNITNPYDQENNGFEARQFHWVLPVDDNGMDSPYADGSRWWFMLGGNAYLGLFNCYADCASWAAEYDLTVHATSEVLPADEYHFYCLRDEDCAGAEEGDA